jgi:MoaA/NifB/PqqE/SkfB family radical SAM enzyme
VSALAVLSLLDQVPDFRGMGFQPMSSQTCEEPSRVENPCHGGIPIATTLRRVRAASRLDHVCVLAWDDQQAAVKNIDASIRVLGPRRLTPSLQETTAALRWADGWRGALLGRTTFDRGFDAEAILAAFDATGADAAVLIDPSSVLIEPATLDALVDQLNVLPEQLYAFAPGAVGSGAMILRRAAIEELARANRGPGSLLVYHPDRPVHDPMAKSFAIMVPPRVARSSVRLTADSTRQIRKLSLVQADNVESAVTALENLTTLDEMPRDVTLELTTRRATKPMTSILSDREIVRPDLMLEMARSIFAQLAAVDDVRLTLAGVGDPLMHANAIAIIEAAHSAGIRAIHVETDLLPDDPATLDALAASEIDVLSFHLPAAHTVTYTKVMGVNRMNEVLENVKRFMLARAARNSGVPILVPAFVKCEVNLGEMEAWYDQWIRAVGTAVITGPSDFSGRIEYPGLATMTTSRRRACRRLTSRMTILSDGTVASCEEDVLGEQACGSAGRIAQSWTEGLAMLRSLHAEHRWDESEVCKLCLMWDRP